VLWKRLPPFPLWCLQGHQRECERHETCGEDKGLDIQDRRRRCVRPGSGQPRGIRQLESMVQSLTAFGLNADDVSVAGRLNDWVLNVAPLEPLPMSRSEAVALAERVHKVIGGK
jgi:hypothetical protein